MQLLKGLNATLYFLLELSMLGAFGYAGFHSSHHPLGKYFIGVGLPLLAATLWGIFAAPRSTHRLVLPYRSLFALTLFGIAFFLLYRAGYPRLAFGLAIIAVVSEITAVVLGE
jgi:hypothetical protein